MPLKWNGPGIRLNPRGTSIQQVIGSRFPSISAGSEGTGINVSTRGVLGRVGGAGVRLSQTGIGIDTGTRRIGSGPLSVTLPSVQDVISFPQGQGPGIRGGLSGDIRQNGFPMPQTIPSGRISDVAYKNTVWQNPNGPDISGTLSNFPSWTQQQSPDISGTLNQSRLRGTTPTGPSISSLLNPPDPTLGNAIIGGAFGTAIGGILGGRKGLLFGALGGAALGAIFGPRPGESANPIEDPHLHQLNRDGFTPPERSIADGGGREGINNTGIEPGKDPRLTELNEKGFITETASRPKTAGLDRFLGKGKVQENLVEASRAGGLGDFVKKPHESGSQIIAPDLYVADGGIEPRKEPQIEELRNNGNTGEGVNRPDIKSLVGQAGGALSVNRLQKEIDKKVEFVNKIKSTNKKFSDGKEVEGNEISDSNSSEYKGKKEGQLPAHPNLDIKNKLEATGKIISSNVGVDKGALVEGTSRPDTRHSPGEGQPPVHPNLDVENKITLGSSGAGPADIRKNNQTSLLLPMEGGNGEKKFDTLLHAILKKDFARPVDYEIIIEGLENMNWAEQYKGALRNILFNATASVIPGETLSTLDHTHHGHPVKHAFKTTYNDLQLYFYCDSNMTELKFFRDWMNYISHRADMEQEYFDNYTAQMRIIQYNREGTKVYEDKLKWAYPTAVADMFLDYSSVNTVHRVPVTITYEPDAYSTVPHISNKKVQPKVAEGTYSQTGWNPGTKLKDNGLINKSELWRYR